MKKNWTGPVLHYSRGIFSQCLPSSPFEKDEPGVLGQIPFATTSLSQKNVEEGYSIEPLSNGEDTQGSLSSPTNSIEDFGGLSTIVDDVYLCLSPDESIKSTFDFDFDEQELLISEENTRPKQSTTKSKQGAKKRIVPTPADSTYDKYRKSNNQASAKSRLKRKEREQRNEELVKLLFEQNGHLKKQLNELKTQYSELMKIMVEQLPQKTVS